jgi:hypothetical protein
VVPSLGIKQPEREADQTFSANVKIEWSFFHAAYTPSGVVLCPGINLHLHNSTDLRFPRLSNEAKVRRALWRRHGNAVFA